MWLVQGHASWSTRLSQSSQTLMCLQTTCGACGVNHLTPQGWGDARDSASPTAPGAAAVAGPLPTTRIMWLPQITWWVTAPAWLDFRLACSCSLLPPGGKPGLYRWESRNPEGFPQLVNYIVNRMQPPGRSGVGQAPEFTKSILHEILTKTPRNGPGQHLVTCHWQGRHVRSEQRNHLLPITQLKGARAWANAK